MFDEFSPCSYNHFKLLGGATMEDKGDQLLTVKEVAQEMRVSEGRVTKWIKNGELAALDLGKDYRIYRRDLDEFIARKRTKRNN
jgi:excisionase family DNA binding protein